MSSADGLDDCIDFGHLFPGYLSEMDGDAEALALDQASFEGSGPVA